MFLFKNEKYIFFIYLIIFNENCMERWAKDLDWTA